MTSRRVLIVEDEMVVQLHLVRIVCELGHEVVVADRCELCAGVFDAQPQGEDGPARRTSAVRSLPTGSLPTGASGLR